MQPAFRYGVRFARKVIKMSRYSYVGLLLCTFCWFNSGASIARADNGTVVSGTVIAVDVYNQVMRVYVTAVDGQALFGGPETNYVDYVVAPDTAVLGANYQLINQSNVVVGSRIQMQFVGAYASRIVLLGNYNYASIGNFGVTANYGSTVNYGMSNSNYPSSYVQSYLPVRNYTTVVTAYRPNVRRTNNSFQNARPLNQQGVTNFRRATRTR